MFTEADRLRLFTRAELQERLGDVCTVEWFLEEFQIPTRCKGRVIAGADLVRALSTPPPAGGKTERPATAAVSRPRPRKAPAAKPGAPPATCAGLKTLLANKG